jgi:hypothetical protein
MTHTACERRPPWESETRKILLAVPPIRRQIEEEPDRTKEIKTERRGSLKIPDG